MPAAGLEIPRLLPDVPLRPAETAGGERSRGMRGRTPLWVGFVVAALLTVYATLTFTAARTQGLSFDEGLQLAVGYNLWRNDDYRIEGANGDLIKRWATLPYLVSRPAFVGRDDPLWKKGDAYELGRRFLFELGNSPAELLQSARAMITLLGVVAGLLVFACSRQLFGWGGGLISLGLFVFCPHMLAFGGIVSTDMSITLTLFAATWWCWQLLHEITWGRLLLSLGWAGLLVLAKPTALVLFPIAAVLIAVKLWHGRPLLVRLGKTPLQLAGRRGQLLAITGLVCLHVLAGWGALWAHYGFRYAASPEPDNPEVAFFTPLTRDRIPPPLVATLDVLARHRVLPEGFLRGIETLLACDDGRGAFVRGQWRQGGWYWFFPYAIWVKTHPALFALLALALPAWWFARRRVDARPPAPAWYAGTPCFVLIGCYLAWAITEDLNIGHRHVLPIYPALFVLAGAVALARVRRMLWLRGTVALALGWLAFDAVAQRPNYLAYFGPQAGGPDQGYRHLVDSSLDWGMNLPALKRWMDQHNPRGREPMFLAYFGTDSPNHYRIRAQRLPGFFERRSFELYALTPGFYAISASLLQSVHTTAFGPWSRAYEELYRKTLRTMLEFEKSVPDPTQRAEMLRQPKFRALAGEIDLFDNLRFARLCAWLRHQGEPHHHVEHAILIWHLDYRDLQAALFGPPAELVERPPAIRLYRHFIAPGQ